MNKQEQLPDLYDIWNYSAPAETRRRFNEILPHARECDDVSYLLQLQTQIARTYSLEAQFDSAHEALDEVEKRLTKILTKPLTKPLALARIRYLLERGRTFNSAGNKSKALTLFAEAYELSKERALDFYAVDAAHMLAIATPHSADKEKWNLIGVAIAEESNAERTRNWLGSLYNNLGWDYFEQQRYRQALVKFEKALDYHSLRGDIGSVNIARWCIAKVYRLLNRIDEALSLQEALAGEYEQSGERDGYVFEELGELHLLKGDGARSREYFAEAYQELSQDIWLRKNESERLERLKKLGELQAER